MHKRSKTFLLSSMVCLLSAGALLACNDDGPEPTEETIEQGTLSALTLRLFVDDVPVETEGRLWFRAAVDEDAQRAMYTHRVDNDLENEALHAWLGHKNETVWWSCDPPSVQTENESEAAPYCYFELDVSPCNKDRCNFDLRIQKSEDSTPLSDENNWNTHPDEWWNGSFNFTEEFGDADTYEARYEEHYPSTLATYEETSIEVRVHDDKVETSGWARRHGVDK